MMPRNGKESPRFRHRGRPEYIHPDSAKKLYQRVLAEASRLKTEILDVPWQIDANFLEDELSGKFMSYVQAIVLAGTMHDACGDTDKLLKLLKSKAKVPELQHALEKPLIEHRKDAEGFLAVIQLYKDYDLNKDLFPLEEVVMDLLAQEDTIAFFVSEENRRLPAFTEVHSAITRAVDLLSIPDIKILTKHELIADRHCQVIYGRLANTSKDALVRDVDEIWYKLMLSQELPQESRVILEEFEPTLSKSKSQGYVAELKLYVDFFAFEQGFVTTSRN